MPALSPGNPQPRGAPEAHPDQGVVERLAPHLLPDLHHADVARVDEHVGEGHPPHGLVVHDRSHARELPPATLAVDRVALGVEDSGVDGDRGDERLEARAGREAAREDLVLPDVLADVAIAPRVEVGTDDAGEDVSGTWVHHDGDGALGLPLLDQRVHRLLREGLDPEIERETDVLAGAGLPLSGQEARDGHAAAEAVPLHETVALGRSQSAVEEALDAPEALLVDPDEAHQVGSHPARRVVAGRFIGQADPG
jgi:hypothetical protein